jgi:hypothetical protein
VLGVRLPRPSRRPSRRPGRPSPWRRPAAEAALVVLLFSLLARWFCAAYFPLDATTLGGPGDFEPYTAMDWVVARTLLLHHELPLWNPYVYSGLPFLGDAYISFFNPFVVGPLLLFGPNAGGKIAVVCAVALSGAGQYWLSRVFGQVRPVALVAGVLGLTAGALVARIASGFNFAQTMQHAWMAATLAAFVVALRTRRPLAIAGAALLYALLFHAGNLYLWLVLSVVLAVFGAGYALTWRGWASGWPVGIDPGAAGVALAVAVLGALLDAVIILPLQALRPLVDKPIDTSFGGTQPALVTLFDFVVSDRQFWSNRLFGASELGWAVHYAYVGAGLFLFLLFLVPAFHRRPGRDLPLLLLACALTVAWASARHTFVWELWRRWDVLQQLRFWATATHVTTMLLIPLAMAGADFLWRSLGTWRERLDGWGPVLQWTAGAPPGAQRWRLGMVRLGLWAVLLAALWRAVADPWSVNVRLWNTPPLNPQAEVAFGWLRRTDPTAYTIQNHDNFSPGFASYAQIGNDISVLNSVWLFKPRLRPTPGAPDGGEFVPAPRYVVQRTATPALPGARLLHTVAGADADIYAAPPGLPFAFTGDPRRLPYGAAGARAVEDGVVTAAEARFDGPNRIVVRVPPDAAAGQSTLVVMQSAFDGWRVRDQRGLVRPVGANGGFLSVPGVSAGETYVLSYRPPQLLPGVALSALGLLAVAGLIWLEYARYGPGAGTASRGRAGAPRGVAS